MLRTILAITLLTTISVFSFGQEKQYKALTIGFYNLENLFDTLDTETTNDRDFLPNGSYAWNTEKYNNKLEKLAFHIPGIGAKTVKEGPAVLGVCEVENRQVLEDLVKQPGLAAQNYEIIHYQSPDERGIDNGFLYQPELFTPTNHKVYHVILDEKGGERDYTRDVLLVSGLLDGEKMHFLVNHWPSRSGGEARSAPKRIEAAKMNKHIIDSIQNQEDGAKIFTMGDFNDDPVSTSLKKTLAAKKSASSLRKNDLFNPFWAMYKKGYGTTAWRDAWSLFDQIIISESVVNTDSGYKYLRAGRFNPDYALQTKGAYKGYPKRTHAGGEYLNGYSDHFAVYVFLIKEVTGTGVM